MYANEVFNMGQSLARRGFTIEQITLSMLALLIGLKTHVSFTHVAHAT